VFTDLVADEVDGMRVALVAGATRCAGRAIAIELARAGFFVFATGRSSRTSGPSELGRPETIEETGDLIRAAGEAGAVSVVDHEDPDAVAELVAAVEREHAELEDHPVTAVGVTPGWLRSERMLENFGVTEATWREACARAPGFAISESPAYVARALPRSPGQTMLTAGLARSPPLASLPTLTASPTPTAADPTAGATSPPTAGNGTTAQASTTSGKGCAGWP
jgi:hypothetical protein